MKVSRAFFRDWRNIENCSVEFKPGINVLWGMNAQGKSNILEGIYFFARGRSFRGARESELIRFGCDTALSHIDFRRDGYENDTSLEVTISKNGKKRITRNAAPLSSPAEMMGSFRAVLFCPSNLSMVCAGPAERRTFLDIALSQLSETYLTYLRRYMRVLRERNSMIKSVASDGYKPSPEEWEVYASQLADYGTNIAAFRSDYVSRLDLYVKEYFADMTSGSETPKLSYSSHAAYEGMPRPLAAFADPSDKSKLYEKLISNTERECAAGATLFGIHKDDINITLNQKEAKLFASQGQQRSIVLSMKLAEAKCSKEIGGEYPVILLDDVFSELDENRRRFVLDILSEESDDRSPARTYGKENARTYGEAPCGEKQKLKEELQIIVTSCEPDVIGRGDGIVNFKNIKEGRVIG